LFSTSPCIDMGDPDPFYNDCEDPNNPGFSLPPSWGTLRNDMGAYGGPNGCDPILWINDNENSNLPEKPFLLGNYPNPFNAQTTIEYSLPEPAPVSVKVFDLLGRKIETLIDRNQQVGLHQVTWSADRYPSGMYFYRIEAGEFSETRKMTLLK